MRNELLARTVYTAEDFLGARMIGRRGLSVHEVDPHTLTIRPGNTRFPVGALDLRSHSDAFFGPGFGAGYFQFSDPRYGQKGLLNLRWIPPATLAPVQVYGSAPRRTQELDHVGAQPVHQDHPELLAEAVRKVHPDQPGR